ncbi:FAD-binding domain-containing protein [Lactarius psammicola]|nr:FAD-binding domain-containing protein [Lactarius psammicola]
MLWAAIFGCALVLATPILGQSGLGPAQSSPENSYKQTCRKIRDRFSPASRVFYPGSPEFEEDIAHWANSSSQVSACSVEPVTPLDVSLILRELAKTRTPFAVKGGGHATNPGFSSTRGVHISMTRFRDIVINMESETVDIGAGLTWTDVYAYLVPKGVNVVGGRLQGVGVAGFILGGGYSWKTNQYGLAVDNVVAYELVLPDGRVTVVTEQDEDIWFALKGGFNNYGIVTKFTLKLHKQTDVWAASLNFAGDLTEVAQAAFVRFLNREHDHRAAQLGELTYSNGVLGFGLTLFYDGPVPPDGLYEELLDLPSTTKSVSKGSFSDFVSSIPTSTKNRLYFDGVPMLHYTEPIMRALANETRFWSEELRKYDKDVIVVYNLDPFEPDYLTHGETSAYPPDRSLAVLPSSIYFGWIDESADKYMADAMRVSSATLVEAGIRDGQDLKDAPPYSNYALFGTPVTRIYGAHVERLHEIREKYDPKNVMGLAGGWKF